MTPQEAILSLLALRKTETQIAVAVGTTQPTINRIKKGAACLHLTGEALIKLAQAELAAAGEPVASVGEGT